MKIVRKDTNMWNTDLALEARDLASAASGEIEGVKSRRYESFKVKVDEIKIINEKGEKALGKKKGTYITLTLPDGFLHDDELFKNCANAISKEMEKLIKERDVLVAGLGNTAVTADSLGPLTADGVISTRHILKNMLPDSFGRVASVKCGVMGQTGIESADIIRGVCSQVAPKAVVTVDALTARSIARLSKTVQISDCGISPGSGVGNTRAELSMDTIGLPVIAIGVPTIVGGATLVADTAHEMCNADRNELYKLSKDKLNGFFVTPKDIDIISERMSKLISASFNMFAHGLEFSEAISLMN